MDKAIKLGTENVSTVKNPVIGVFAPCDFRIDEPSRQRTANIIKMTADTIASRVKLVDGTPVKVVYSDVLIDGEKQDDVVARQFEAAGVNNLVGVPDTWSLQHTTLL